ncbi:MAG TPA: hypothetical protein VM243_13350 [Phycisphaerae bacterium]|nr:hypothetical protein [Phycisphaerae bacterium]
MMITGILLGATASTVHLMTRTGIQARGAAQEQNAAKLAMLRMRRELRMALAVSEMSATAVTFTHPDIDGDGGDDVIRYAWSGSAGDSLTRQVNAAAAAPMLEGVQRFELSYDIKEGTEEAPGPDQEGAEERLIYYDSSYILSDARVHDNQWWAQYFKPDLPAEAVGWKVTRVFFQAKRDHSDDTTTTIQLRLAKADMTPSDTVIDQTTMDQLALLDQYEWVEKSFANATNVSPDEGLCLAFITYDANSARLRYRSGGVYRSDMALAEGDPGWTAIYTDKALLFYVYGTVTTKGPAVAMQRLAAVTVGLTVGTDPPTRLDSGVQVLNAPEVTKL